MQRRWPEACAQRAGALEAGQPLRASRLHEVPQSVQLLC